MTSSNSIVVIQEEEDGLFYPLDKVTGPRYLSETPNKLEGFRLFEDAQDSIKVSKKMSIREFSSRVCCDVLENNFPSFTTEFQT